ncbi:MAG: RlmE family RNA methyltransferase [Deltaproteobacteria bacterium]|nr:RlmE family RNA methyltransferase [Deltaproteobacteria bacterium]
MKRRNNNSRSRADFYARKAQKENFPARSVYKLEEIQAKYRVIRPAARVLDLGCSPGSWLLYAAKIVGPKGMVVGVDLKEVNISLPVNVRAHVGDVTAVDDLLPVIGSRFDAVISDMAPATTGRKDVDAARSYNLCRAALDTAEATLAPGGSFVCKIFQGEDFTAFSDSVLVRFDARRIFKPQTCRKDSREIYIIGLGRKK